MPPREVEIMLRKQQAPGAGAEQIIEKIKVPFDKGDKIRVRDGTFAGMEGEVKEIMEAKDSKDSPRVRVELTIFGRPVPVEVEVWQVEQL
jgi:transcriptional antiterminator NusG